MYRGIQYSPCGLLVFRSVHRRGAENAEVDVYVAMGGTPDPLQHPSGTVDGCYYNYPDNVLGTHADQKIDQAMWLYFLDNFRNNERNLVDVKRYWEPENYFHHPQSIPLS